MKRADAILAKTENGLPQQSWISRTSTGKEVPADSSSPASQLIDDRTKALVNMIFARFMAIYGHKFKSAFETEDEIRIAKREWALSLRGFTEQELVAAVNQCKETLAWMPSISEFLQIIESLSGSFGLPNVHEAYREACFHAEHPLEHSWSHPAVYWSGKQTDWFRLRTETESEVFPLFAYNYELNVRKVRAGEELTTPNLAAIEQKSELVQAVSMLDYAEANQIDEEVACKLLYYTTLPKGSRTRARMYAQARQEAEALGLTLPTDS